MIINIPLLLELFGFFPNIVWKDGIREDFNFKVRKIDEENGINDDILVLSYLITDSYVISRRRISMTFCCIFNWHWRIVGEQF